MDGGLPYDADDSGPTRVPDMDGDHPMLDKALDDYTVPVSATGSHFGFHERSVVSEHAANLLGRMGRSKVYLAEESPGIIHHDAEERLRRDPALARLAQELDKQDPTSWLDAISETSSSPIRPNALFVSSTLIKHLSTAKVFTWTSQVGAAAMGIEWLNDSTLVLLFATPASALLGLSMLAKAGFDPTEGDDPLLERAAHAIPVSLLPRAEPKPEIPKITIGDEPMEASDGIRRRGRGKFAAGESGGLEMEPIAAAQIEFDLADGVDPHARVTVRYAMESDAKERKKARDSEWYARHGRSAGKEVARRNYTANGTGYGQEIIDLKDRLGTSGEGKEFARRIGRERRDDRVPRGGRARIADLDADLDRMVSRRAAGEDFEEERSERSERSGGERGRGRGRREPRGRRNADDLDRELDEMFAARTATE